MKLKARYITDATTDFLNEKMVFIGGPRQVGKTTFCLNLLDDPQPSNPAYLNWDDLSSQHSIRKGLLPSTPLLILDEIHKYPKWRNLIKGFYDKKKNIQKFLVTGSARLDHYRRGGDSLLGRYRYLRLHPLSVSELKISTTKDLQSLLHFGGFPEPFFSQSNRKLKLWHRERQYRIIHDDIRSLESVRDLTQLDQLAEALPERIGSPLSINNLAQDLGVNFRTAENWVSILERIYFCYRLLPFGAPKIKAVRKEKKLYLWDWSLLQSEGARFENLVASHLLKYCHFLEDTEGDVMELRYLRDIEKREIDFVILKNKKPLFAVECKSGEKQVAAAIHYFKARTSIPLFYQVHLGHLDYEPEEGIRVLPFLTFCKEVNLT